MAKEVWLLISIAAIVVLLGIITLVVVLRGRKKRKTDYYTLFIMGIIWLPCGVAIGNYALSAVGLIFMILGLAHKKEWKKNIVPWKKMSKSERMIKTAIIILSLLLLVASIALYFFINSKAILS